MMYSLEEIRLGNIRLRQLAQYVKSTVDDDHFSMLQYYDRSANGETVGCLAGYACEELFPELRDDLNMSPEVNHFFALTIEEGNEVFAWFATSEDLQGVRYPRDVEYHCQRLMDFVEARENSS